MRQAGLFGLSDHLKRLSAHGDPLEVLARVVDFEAFRPTLVEALGYSDGTKGGRPPYDPVTMLKVLVLAAQNNVSDARIDMVRALHEAPGGLAHTADPRSEQETCLSCRLAA